MPRAKKAPSATTKPSTSNEAPAKPVASVQPEASKAGVQSKSNGEAKTNGDLEAAIRARAYELYEKRGRGDGLHHEDWVQAEREIRSRHQQQSRRSA